ncbi:MAG: class I SAM-dependent methyltransferase [Lachnospiraceae bacterium]|nr:class I SAM-dependent methyltransferase [Lachnospiraceae bacterium]
MNEKDYYSKVYGKYWQNQTRKYGYTSYEQNLVRLISKSLPEKVFEVGIGTGWPVGTALKEKGIIIDGCDLSESSVALARKELENETGIWIGDVLSYNGEAQYDVVYCVRVSWLIPDFFATVAKMISMTKPGGEIIFDVMDKDSLYCREIRWRLVKEIYYRFLGIEVDETYGTHFINLRRMKRFLKKNGLSCQFWGEREITGNQDKSNTPKVVFVCRKDG